jgi:PST family polysaccharide transporter
MTYFADNRSSSDLGRQSVRSGVASVAARAVNGVIQIGALIFLARLLSPSDFGLVAMVSAITGFAPFLIDLGLSDATVQRPAIRPEDVSALFWITSGLGLLLTLLVAFVSPLIAQFYHEPRLELIAIVSAPALFLTALSLQHQALMRRAMMFNEVAVITVGANLVSVVVALAMAFGGSGYWALVAKPIVTAAIALVGVLFVCRWWPGRPAFGATVKELIGFGVHVTGFTFADFIGRNVDRVGLGYFYGPRDLGFYEKAVSVYESSLYFLAGPLHSVATSSLSKLRDDLEQFRRSYADAISTLAFFGMPAFAFLVVAGQDLVVLLMGEKWLYAGTLLSVIALCGPAHLVERTQGWLHVAAGRPDRWARWGVVSSVAQLGAVACGLPFGALGVAWAYTICIYVLFIPCIVYAGRPVGIRPSFLIKALAAQFVAALASIVIVLAMLQIPLSGMAHGTRLVISFLVCGSVYFIIVVGLFRVKRPLQIALSVALDVLPERFHGLISPFMRWTSRRKP